MWYDFAGGIGGRSIGAGASSKCGEQAILRGSVIHSKRRLCRHQLPILPQFVVFSALDTYDGDCSQFPRKPRESPPDVSRSIDVSNWNLHQSFQRMF
jgi:hypothetical protein